MIRSVLSHCKGLNTVTKGWMLAVFRCTGNNITTIDKTGSPAHPEMPKQTLCTNMCRPHINKKDKCSDDSHSSAKLEKTWHISHTKHAVLMFFMYVATMHCLNYGEQKKTICSLWFWHTFDLEIRSRSSNLVWFGRPQARSWPCKVWKTS